MRTPDTGVEAREDAALDMAACPFTPFEAVLLKAGDFLAPHAGATGAEARGFGPPPNAGNNSSDFVSSVALLSALGSETGITGSS